MFFLSGVMVGSGAGETTAAGVRMVPQDYRTVLREALLKEDPAAVVVDPLELGEQRATEWYVVDLDTIVVLWGQACACAFLRECVNDMMTFQYLYARFGLR